MHVVLAYMQIPNIEQTNPKGHAAWLGPLG